VKIQIKQLKPGMILSSDVTGPNGFILAPANRMLTAEIILLFSKNGIFQADIKEHCDSTKQSSLNSEDDIETIRKKKLPSLKVITFEDGMTATLIIEPTQPDNSNLTIDDIKTILDNKQVVSGLNEKYIESAVKNWNERKHRYEISGIALGTPPEPAIEGDLHLSVRYLSTEKEVRKVRSCRYIWQAEELTNQVQRIKPGMIIAEKQIAKPSVPGKNIKGELIFTEQVIKKEFSCGNGITYSHDTQEYKAESGGVLSFINDTLEVVPVNFDGSVDIEITPNKMKADLIYHKPHEDGNPPSEKEIRDTIENSDINTGLDESRIKEIIAGLNAMTFSEERVTIAQGTAPINGANGKITYHFNTETSLKPKENPDGSVDYKSVDIVISVSKNDKLVTLIPPEMGTPGKTIFGNPVPCMNGLPAKLPLGPNTIPDPQHPDILIAATDGIVRLVGPIVEICEGFVINGSVDFSTGNVKYGHSVIVTGDIKTGFEVECGGDLQTSGTIEDSILKIGGNVLCRFGFCGQGKGIIDAKGDVNLGFMKNQTVRSKKNVNIAREAINSTIYARETIQIHGKPLSVAGGHLTAGESITMNTVGNHSGIRTICEVGFDFTIGEELRSLEEHLSELLLNQNKILENIKKIEKTLTFQKRLALKDQAIHAKLKESLTKYDQQIKALEIRKKIIEKKLYNFEKVFIRVERSAYPGTIFKFGERHFLVKEEINGPKIVKLIDFEIKLL
jgi:uncharacterized protein (DUF342 family)